MAREFKVTSRLWKRFPLAPRAILLCEDIAELGAPFLIMQYRPGLVIHMDLPEALESKTADLSKMIIKVLHEFQNVDPAQVELDDLGRPEGFLERARAGWIKRFKVAAADVYPQQSWPKSADAIMHQLENQPIPPSDSSLLHNDFKLNNIILDPSNPIKPIALLDWDMCTRGCPLYDLAILLSYWTEPDDHPAMHQLRQMPSAAPGFPSRAEVLEAYARRSGIDIGDFRFYRVLSVFRLAIVFRQLVNLYRRGARTSPEFAGFGDVAAGLLDFAEAIADGRCD